MDPQTLAIRGAQPNSGRAIVIDDFRPGFDLAEEDARPGSARTNSHEGACHALENICLYRDFNANCQEPGDY